jgi:hypothetical protein
MRTLLLKACLLAALVVGPAVAVFLLPLPYSRDHDLSAILNKRDLLKDSRHERIIFVGGSGLFSGLDSELIQERLHRPAVNMGLYAGFGITPLLREINPYLRRGDIVVIIPEYSVVFDEFNVPARKWLLALAPSRNLLTLYEKSWDGLYSFIHDINELVRLKFRAFPEAVRERIDTRRLTIFLHEGDVVYDKYFNGCGDSLRFFPAAASSDLLGQRNGDYFSGPDYLHQSLTVFNDLCREAAGRGVKTFFVFPAYPEKEYQRQQEGMRAYEQRLRKELLCPVLGSPRDFLYPYRYFTDTVHHLCREGKRIRTERVIELLEQVPMMSRSSPGAPET